MFASKKKKVEESPQVPPPLPPQAEEQPKPPVPSVPVVTHEAAQVQPPQIQAPPVAPIAAAEPPRPIITIETQAIIAQLKINARRLQFLERQLMDKVVELDTKVIGSLRQKFEILNEAEILKQELDELTHALNERDFSLEEVYTFVNEALNGIEGYTWRIYHQNNEKQKQSSQ